MKRLAITAGEPAGIGPDLCITLAQQPQNAQLIVLADPELLHARAKQLGLPLTLRTFDAGAPIQAANTGELWVMPHRLGTPSQAGVLNRANARYVLDTLTSACQGCQNGTFDAMVTAPVHKGVINEAGIPFSGHTEFLADLTDTPLVVMMLATEGLRVALVTTHLPLREISDAITPERLAEITQILHRDLVGKFGLKDPRILVCGLNPHAGEGGHLGREELDVIIPTLEKLRANGLNLEGPLPADTAFTPLYLERADTILAMYHDQGLPVLKHKGFGQAVNITLGLPIIRTSVDHGTALDLAGTGKAHIGSLETAIQYALEMSCTQ